MEASTSKVELILSNFWNTKNREIELMAIVKMEYKFNIFQINLLFTKNGRIW